MGISREEYEEFERKLKDEKRAKSPLANCIAIQKYLTRVGGAPTSLRGASISDFTSGYKVCIGRISFDEKLAEVKADIGFEPTELESADIAAELRSLQMPNPISFPTSNKVFKELETMFPAGENKSYVFKSLSGETIMHLVRIEKDDGSKYFLPYSYWDDSEVRCCEPDGKLPLFGLEHVKRDDLVWIHEGPKSAAFWQRLTNPNCPILEREELKNHPFADELSVGVHVGWHGGAGNPERTDFSTLKSAGVKEIIIIADKDNIGRSAAYKIARITGLKAKIVQFDEQFPTGFDLADEIPRELKSYIGNATYMGPSLKSMMYPATYAAYRKMQGKKAVYKPNKAFLEEWIYVTDAEVFIHEDFPSRRIRRSAFNDEIRRFSDTPQVAELLLDNRLAEAQSLAYNPSKPSGLISNGTRLVYNVYYPPVIPAGHIDVRPFLDFMEYLIPDANDRTEVIRFCATLIAKPETKIHYGLLLVSEAQGTGKTTLAQRILAPLVGFHNTSFPSEITLSSQFNSWLAYKRLAVFGEIYQGQSWKTYNMLKEIITDSEIEVNEKYQKSVTIDNWTHIIACSNSKIALKVDQDDRRWLVPTVTENPWPEDEFKTFFIWLETGGLFAIKKWAAELGNYIEKGSHAPTSSAKRDMVELSRSEHVQYAIEMLDHYIEDTLPRSVSVNELRDFVKRKCEARCFDQLDDFKRALKSAGWSVFDGRISQSRRNHYFLLNEAARKETVDRPANEVNQKIREIKVDLDGSQPF